jgi:hypothetical protein
MSFENLNHALSALQNYEGKFFIGVVKDAADPEQLDRVKAFIPGLYQSADPALLPWAAPIKYSPMGQGVGPNGPYGTFGAPPVDSEVLVILQEGNPHYPLYMSIMRNKNTEFPEGAWGWKDTYGNKFIVGPDGVELSTKCGARINIDKNCKITMDAPGGFEFNGDQVFNGNQIINGDSRYNGNQTYFGNQVRFGSSILNGAVVITGDTTVNGDFDLNGDQTIDGKLDVTKNIVSEADVIASGTSLKGHIHAVLSKDFGVTSPPT